MQGVGKTEGATAPPGPAFGVLAQQSRAIGEPPGLKHPILAACGRWVAAHGNTAGAGGSPVVRRQVLPAGYARNSLAHGVNDSSPVGASDGEVVPLKRGGQPEVSRETKRHREDRTACMAGLTSDPLHSHSRDCGGQCPNDARCQRVIGR